MNKIAKMNEAAWVTGTLLCALGRVLCTKAGLGLSMIGAPSYILHLFLVKSLPWFSQGTAEYFFQALLIIPVCFLVRKIKLRYIASFLTAIVLGLAVDGWLLLFGGNDIYTNMAVRIICFILGEGITALSIAFLFRTSMPLQMYEVFVIEVSDIFKIDKNKVKLGFDIGMFVLSVVLALVLNRNLNGVGIGTLIITVVNAPLIAFFGKLIDKIFVFDMRFPGLEKFLK